MSDAWEKFLDMNPHWDKALKLLEEQGEDVPALLRKAADDLEAARPQWRVERLRPMTGIKHLHLDSHLKSGKSVLVGRKEGESARRDAMLDGFDSEPEVVIQVIYSPVILSMTSSFVRGMFGPSVEKLGVDEFRRKYRFSGRDVAVIIDDLCREVSRGGRSVS